MPARHRGRERSIRRRAHETRSALVPGPRIREAAATALRILAEYGETPYRSRQCALCQQIVWTHFAPLRVPEEDAPERSGPPSRVHELLQVLCVGGFAG